MPAADLTVITPTSDQPAGMSLLAHYLAAQTVKPKVWLIVDDGDNPVTFDPPCGQVSLRRAREPDCHPVQSLCRNLGAALPFVATEYVAILEHDDYYRPRHLETLLDHLTYPSVLLAGDDEQRYYNVATRQWQVYDNWRGGSLYTTGFRSSIIPTFQEVLELCDSARRKGVDAELWRHILKPHSVTYRARQAVGIKGLPGRAGIGVGHTPDSTWHSDPHLAKLREWVGDEGVGIYRQFYTTSATQTDNQPVNQVA